MLSTHCFAHLAVSSIEIVFLWEIITNKTTEANFTCPVDHQTSIFTCPRTKFTCPRQWDLGFFLPCTWNTQLFLLTFGEEEVLFWPYRFRQYSTHVWYGFEVFGQPFTGPSTLGSSSGFSLSNVNERNENMSILHDSYGGKNTKNLPQWAIPFFIGILLSPIEILRNLGKPRR